MQERKFHKSHRLDINLYEGQKLISYTICIENRKQVFTDKILVEKFTTELINQSWAYNCNIHIYLFMPDHLHILCEGINDDSNSYKMIKSFKQRTGYFFSKNIDNIKWQKSFYDHILRKDVEIKNQIYYILNNPVRSEVYKSWQDYPYKGSTLYNFNEWS